MVANGRSPYTHAVSRSRKDRVRLQSLQGMAYQLPMHQITRVENGQTRQTVKGTRRKIIVIAHGDYVRITVIGIEHRIRKSSIPIVRVPYLRDIILLAMNIHSQERDKAQNK